MLAKLELYHEGENKMSLSELILQRSDLEEPGRLDDPVYSYGQGDQPYSVMGPAGTGLLRQECWGLATRRTSRGTVLLFGTASKGERMPFMKHTLSLWQARPWS